MFHSRRRAVPVGVLSVTLALLLIGSGPADAGRTPPPPVVAVAEPPPPGPSPGRAGVLPVSPAPGRGGLLAELPTPARVGVAGAPITVRYTFDGGVGRPIADVTGRHQLRPLGQNGGTLRLVRQRGGLAVAYPDRCKLLRERDCPRAILEGTRNDNLNPGRRSLRYGASILMTHGDLADGANVVQKGYSVGGMSQFKLQVDHQRGRPSCVIAGQRARIYRAEPLIDVADGTWHNLECRRTSNRLTLVIDGVPYASVPIPPALSIANTEPLRIGGKGAAQGNDQFAGTIDDVFVSIA